MNSLRAFAILSALAAMAPQAMADDFWSALRYSVGIRYLEVSAPNASSPRPKSLEMPEYPGKMAERGLSGEVYVTVKISESGTVTDIQTSKESTAGLGEVAKKTIARWQFYPAVSVQTGRAVPSELTCRVEFSAEEVASTKATSPTGQPANR
jgi:TonB family protein